MNYVLGKQTIKINCGDSKKVYTYIDKHEMQYALAIQFKR